MLTLSASKRGSGIWISLALAISATCQPISLLAATATGGAASDDKSALWAGIIFAVGISVAAAVLQHREKLVIFRDYTDATITAFTFLLPFAAFWILKSNQSDQTLLWLVSGGLLAVAVSLMLINTADANGGVANPYFLLAVGAKIIFTAIFLGLVALMVACAFGGSVSKRPNETQWEYEERKRKEARQTAAAAAGLTALMVAAFRVFCKDTAFRSAAPTFAAVKRIFARGGATAAAQDSPDTEPAVAPARPLDGAVCLALGVAAAIGWWHYATPQSARTARANESEPTASARTTPQAAPQTGGSSHYFPPTSTTTATPPQAADSVTPYQPKRQSGSAVLDFDEALQRANDGDAYAQAVISIYFGLGYKTSKDLAAAADYATRSAAQGHPLGIYRMGSIVQTGDGAQKNAETGKAMKIQSLRGLDQMTGDPYAMTALGIMLFRGEGVEKNREAAARLYRAAAETGYAPALYNYSACLMAGFGVAQDQQLALQYWRAAYDQNYPPAMDGPPPTQ